MNGPPERISPPSSGLDEIEFLSTSAVRLAECTTDEDLYGVIAQQLAHLEPECVVVTSSYEPSSSSTVVRAMVGPPAMLSSIRAFLGGDAVGLSFTLNDAARRSLAEGTLDRLDGGMRQLTFEVIPEETCRAFEALLGLRSIYAQPFARKGDYLGTAAFLSPLPRLWHERLIEAFTRQAAVAIQRQRAERELRLADRRKNDFLAVLSHELRNPLSPIRNSLFVLKHVPAGSEQAERAHAVIERQVDHLVRLIDDLLDVTRISRGKVQLRNERLEVNELVRRAVDDHQGAFQRQGVALTLQLDSPEVWVRGDPTRLAQVVGNLLQNAVKFTPRGGSACVRVDRDLGHDQAILRVRDTGTGIAPDLLPRLFQPFMQADRTIDRSKGGLGLGLALVKGLVELHGGSVSASSEGVGHGAEMIVRLPLDHAETASRRQGEPAKPVAAAPRRVLVIEDNVDAANSLREVLELRANIVEVAFTGDEGLAKARRFRPDIVLCDLGLPGMDGYEVARSLRADPLLRRARLVALTGYAAPEDVARSAEAGFDLHLPKPPSIEALERILADNART